MASGTDAPRADVVRGVPALMALGVLGATTGAGYVAVRFAMPLVHDRYLPWIAGRTFGMAAYGAIFLLVLVGLWLRHPWRSRWTVLHPEVLLRLHATLGASVIVLVAGHVTSLALDRYAGVGWSGAFIPGAALYRPLPVAVGVCAVYGLLIVAGTAGIGGRLAGRAWRPLHLLALPVFAAVWCHGLLAGSDGMRLRVMYGITGSLVVALALTRLLAASRYRAFQPGSARASHLPPGGGWA